VGCPDLFEELIDWRILSANELECTKDDFFLCTVSLADILTRNGITKLGDDAVAEWWDDWYIFAIVDEDGNTKYGLCKMREQENDGGDNDNPGVSVSFAAFNEKILLNCIELQTKDAITELHQYLPMVINVDSLLPNGLNSHDKTIVNYFADETTDGAFLIAKTYVKIIANTREDGKIFFSNLYKKNLERIKELNTLLILYPTNPLYWSERAQLLRIPSGIENIEKEDGIKIYNEAEEYISIGDQEHLSEGAQCIILALFAGTISFPSFAAEVQFHAEETISDRAQMQEWYTRAVKADMSVEIKYEVPLFEEYYNLESEMVKIQANNYNDYINPGSNDDNK